MAQHFRPLILQFPHKRISFIQLCAESSIKSFQAKLSKERESESLASARHHKASVVPPPVINPSSATKEFLSGGKFLRFIQAQNLTDCKYVQREVQHEERKSFQTKFFKGRMIFEGYYPVDPFPPFEELFNRVRIVKYCPRNSISPYTPLPDIRKTPSRRKH